MKSHWIEKSFAYDGSQLRSLFAYLGHGVLGDSVVAWRGPCAIPVAHMVDGEDVLAGSTIAGSDMLHFIVEKFRTDLVAGVAIQRLLASLCLDVLREGARAYEAQAPLRRDGDDIYWGERKFSISIATVSPVSALVHFAVNCKNAGTPVPTCALEDFGLEPRAFAAELLQRFAREMGSLEEATRKVRWVP